MMYLDVISLWFRVLISILLILFLPGSGLSLLIFERKSIKFLEFVFVSILLSVVVSSVIASIQLVYFGEANTVWFLGVNVVFTAVMLSGYIVKCVAKNERIVFFDRLLLGRTVVGLMVCVLLAGFMVAIERYEGLNGQSGVMLMTEFYVNPESADAVRGGLSNGVDIDLPVYIVNREGREMEYIVEVWGGDAKIVEYPNIVLGVDQKWERELVIPKLSGGGVVELRLMDADDGSLVAKLRFSN